MNKIEEIVYHALYSHPKLKLAVRNLYQGVFDLMPRKKNYFSGDYDIKEGYFFGFHDVPPFSTDETKVLACKYSFDLRMPKAGEGIEVGYLDFNNGKMGDFHQIGETKAWNWHKGCRLQWLNKKEVIFNNAVDGKIICTIANVETKETRNLPHPIDTAYVSEKESIATTFSYERLQVCMPGYGYPYSDESYLNEKAPKETGLFLMDLNSGERKLIVPVSVLVEKYGKDNVDKYYHYVTHTEFSKDGRYISFLYRRMEEGGDINKRITMMVVYDRQTNELILLPTQVSGSHYVWNGKNQIIASCIIDGKSCHVLYDMNDVEHYKIIRPDVLNQDGHQTFVNDDVFVTDTYPDKWRQSQLYVANMADGNVKKILSINSPKKFQCKTVYNYIDCDLHPRMSPSGKYVCCDTVMTGRRGLLIINI